MVERKTVPDLHRSIASGRIWRQIGSLRAAELGRLHLLVEGVSCYEGPVAPEGVRGALLAIADSGVVVIQSGDVDESAAWIRSIAIRALQAQRRPRRRQPRASSQYELLRSMRGVTPASARRLIERFGTVARVASASECELLDVRGVGPTTAAELRRVLSSGGVV